jgi:GNAT superfamily N-acetyltransferase
VEWNEHDASVRVREATFADAEALAELSRQLGYPSTPAQVRARMESIAASPEHSIFMAEFASGKPAGMMDIFVMRTVESDARAELAGLVVDESCRSMGVGRVLLRRAEEWAREHACASVTLRSNVIRERAHAFYLRKGYSLVKTQRAFRKQL